MPDLVWRLATCVLESAKSGQGVKAVAVSSGLLCNVLRAHEIHGAEGYEDGVFDEEFQLIALVVDN